MKLLHAGALPLVGALFLILAGCQHIPPKPYDGQEIRLTWEALGQDWPSLAELSADPGTLEIEGIDLEAAEAIALARHPGLLALRAEALYVGQARAAAGLLPDWNLDLEIGRKAEEDESGTEHSRIGGAGLSITIPLSGRLGAARRVAEAEYQAALRQVEEGEWEHLHELHEAWIAWSARHWEQQVLEAHLTLLDPIATSARALAEVGELEPVMARLFTIEAARREGQLGEVAALVTRDRIRVLALMGLPPETEMPLSPTLAIHPEWTIPEEDFRARILAQHPELQRLAAEYAVAEAQLVAALREQYPDIVLSPGIMDERNETAIVAGLGIPLPVWNRNRAGIAAALIERERRYGTSVARQAAVLSQFEAARAAWRGIQERRSHLETEVAPLLEEQLEEARQLLEMGELDFMLMETVLDQSIDFKLELIAARREEALAEALARHYVDIHHGAETQEGESSDGREH